MKIAAFGCLFALTFAQYGSCDIGFPEEPFIPGNTNVPFDNSLDGMSISERNKRGAVKG